MVGLPRIPSSATVLFSDLLESRTVMHRYHLAVKGTGSYATHKALNEYYDEVGDLVDSVIESYQGVAESLVALKASNKSPVLTTNYEAIEYLRELYSDITKFQSTCNYSEINNDLDTIKTLINSTKYKLIYLS